MEGKVAEKEDEIKHKDFCTDGLNQNERAQELKQRDIEELEVPLHFPAGSLHCRAQ